ncbi:MAG TPA: hypothetical protein VLI39_13155 [Sedimentisphaerales bacterium]|nr:hypothetical protein [Sedimentisphaerales bacterium]
MKTSKQAVVMIVSLTTVMLGMQASASQQAAKTPSNTWQMRCIMKVTADAEVLPLSHELLESLLRSDAVAGAAAKTVWPRGHGTSDAYFSIRRLGGSDAQESLENDIASPPSVAPLPAGTQTALFDLHVHLDNDVGPVAKEFGEALIENLCAELRKAVTAHRDKLKRQLEEAESQRKTFRTELQDAIRRGPFASTEPILRDPRDQACHERLRQDIDFSRVTKQTPVAEAFDILRHAVDPPLNLVVLWRDLLDNANVEPSSPAQIDGPASVQLAAALRSLLDAITDLLAAGDEYRVDYVIDGGAITIATRAGLPRPKLETRVYNLPPLLRTADRVPELAALIRETTEPQSWRGAGLGSSHGTVVPSADGRLIVSQSRETHIKIQDLLAKVTVDIVVSLPGEASQETLAERLEFLLPYREQLEQELDRLQERQGRLSRERNEEGRLAVQSIGRDLHTATTGMKEMLADMAKGRRENPQFAELHQAVRVLEQCANRCRVVASGPFDRNPWPGGGEEGTVAQRLAAKQSDLREVSRRIAETQAVSDNN